MASIIPNYPTQGDLDQDLPPWYRMKWSPEVQKSIFKNWGSYYSRKGRENFATFYYTKAMELAPDDFQTLNLRSRSKRKVGQAQGALNDCRQAQEILQKSRTHNSLVNMEVCQGLYELNQFENAKAELHNNARAFSGQKTRAFQERLFVDENIKDALGNGLTPFIEKHDDVMYYVKEIAKAKEKENDGRPRWKMLRDQGKCDAKSIPDIEEELLSPIEIARRRRAFEVFTQVYIGKAWVDVVFLKNLRRNPTLILDQCPLSKAILQTLRAKQYEVIKTFLKSLHAREPMYYKRNLKFSNQKIRVKFHEDYLYRIQFQTRRNMIEMFGNIRRLHANRELVRLERYVEAVMGDYVVLKTYRIMPWKFEFMNEVYNSLALALIDQYGVPATLRTCDKNALFKLLRIPKDKPMEPPGYVFGVRSKRKETMDGIDINILKARKLLTRLEDRAMFSNYAIERSYLYHQIANIHLRAHRFDDCLFKADKALDETKKCNSYIWRFLCKMLVIKTHASLYKFERTKIALLKARFIAHKLKSSNLIYYIDVCMAANDEAALAKKASLVSRRESKLSDLSN